MGGGAAVTIQENFRFGAADGSESAHGWLAILNANITAGDTGAGKTIEDGDQVFLRFTVANTGTKDENSDTYEVHLSVNGGSYALVPAVGSSQGFHYANNATYLTHNTSTTDRLGGTGTFDTTNYGVIENTNETGTANIIAQAYREEILIVLEFDLASVPNPGDNTYDFQVKFNGGGDLDSYSQTARVTATKPITYVGEIFADGFESGDFTGWSQGASGTPTVVTSPSPPEGTYWQESYIDGAGTDEDVQENFSPAHSTDKIRFRFYFDLNNIISAMSPGNELQIVRVQTSSLINHILVYVDYLTSTTYRLRVRILDDISGSQFIDYSGLAASGINYVEVYELRETGTSQNGSAQAWLNGTSMGTLSSLDNGAVVDDIFSIQMGNVNVTGTYTGTIYTDAMVVRDDDTLIGPVSTSNNGTLNETLANLTLSGVGTVDIDGDLAKTLENLTLTGIGDVQVKGTLSKTLENLTLDATGGVPPISGSLIKTLADLTVSATGDVLVTGDLNKTLENLTAASLGQVLVEGNLSKTLEDIAISASGDVLIQGNLSRTLESLVLAGTSTVLVQGALSKTLGELLLEATGNSLTPPVEGNLSKTLANLTLTGLGDVLVSGSLSKTLENLTPSGVGEVLVRGNLTTSLEDLVGAGVGSVLITGALSKTLGLLVLSGTATNLIEGSLNKTLQDLILTGAGSTTGANVGILNAVLANLTLTGAGTVDIDGTLTKTLEALTLSGQGQVLNQGSLAKTLADLTLSGWAQHRTYGNLGVTLQDLVATATGGVKIAGLVSQSLNDLSLLGQGKVQVQGILDITLDDIVCAATGSEEAYRYASLDKTLEALVLTSTGTVLGLGQVTLSEEYIYLLSLSEDLIHQVALSETLIGQVTLSEGILL